MYGLKAIIVDDEIDALKTLRELIKRYCNDIEVIAEANSVESTLEKLEYYSPDILFLDVELSDGTGFDILRRVPCRNFDTIFVTAYNHYSIKAFKFSAIDYLLKPVDIDELCNAVNRLKSFRERSQVNSFHDYDVLIENLDSGTPKKFVLPTSEGLELISIDEVVLIKADGSYSELLFSNGKRKMVAKLLKEFQDRLYEQGFFRSHNSFLINLRHVKKLLRKDGGCIEMSDGTIAALSKRNIDIFKRIMEHHINFS